MHQEILIPTDGSEESMRCVDEGLELADTYDASVHTLYVVDESIRARGLVGMQHPGLIPTLRQVGEDATDEISSRYEQEGIDMTTAIREGVPHESILSYADENDIDGLVEISSQ